MNRKIKLFFTSLIFILFYLFFWINNSFAINISDNTSFNISHEVEYTLTWVTSDPLEEVTFTGSYILWAVMPWYCKYIYPATYLHFHTKSYLNSYSSYSSIIASDNSWSWRWWSACNDRINRSWKYTTWIPKDFFYFNYPYWDSNAVFTYNSDWNLTIQKTYWVNTYSSLSFSSRYFLYNDVYVSYWSDTLSYRQIDYSDLSSSLLDTRPYPSWFLTPSYIPFPYIDSFWNMKGWLYSCNSNNSICFLNSNWDYFREVIINSAWKLVWPLKFHSSDTKYIFSSNLWNNVIVYNKTFNESGWSIDLVEFEWIQDWNWDEVIYFTWTTLDIIWNYYIDSNRVFLKDFNDFKNSSDDITYFYDLNCITPWYTFVSYFADNNKFYCASEEWEYSIQASDWNYYSSTCYNDIVNWGYICDDSIKSPNTELAYNPLTWENSWYIPETNTWTTDISYNEPLNWLWINWCDYFDNVDSNSCNEWEYLVYDSGSLICWATWTPTTCDNECSPYLYLDSRLCASSELNDEQNIDNPVDDSSLISTLIGLFSTSSEKIDDLNNSLSWALSLWTSWFSIWDWWTSWINFIPWNEEYWEIINRNNNNLTCDMFNQDWSFAYYSNWSYDLSIDLNGILNLGYTDKVPFLEELLYIPNKILSFITNPLNNIFSTLRVFWWIWENTYCYFGTLQTIQFQKHIMVWASFFWWELIFIPWTLTILDYMILFFMWIPMLIITVRILLY